MERVPSPARRSPRKRDRLRLTDAVTHCWYGNANLYHDRFDRAFAARPRGAAHAVALPSCTSAIHLALAALGIGPGDEVSRARHHLDRFGRADQLCRRRAGVRRCRPAAWCLAPNRCRGVTPGHQGSDRRRFIRPPAWPGRGGPGQIPSPHRCDIMQAPSNIGSRYQAGRRAVGETWACSASTAPRP